MSNFINKNSNLHNPLCKDSQNISNCEIVKKQGCATQCLLDLSENPELGMQKLGNLSNIQVAPWANSVFKPQVNKLQQKAKSIEGRGKGGDIFFENRGQKVKLLENKQNRILKQSSQKGKVKLLRRNSESIKKSYSTIAKYTDCTEIQSTKQLFSQQTFDLQTTYTECNNNSKRKSVTAKKKTRVLSKMDKQNCFTELITCMIPKQEDKQMKNSRTELKDCKVQEREPKVILGGVTTGAISRNCAWLSNESESKNQKQRHINHIEYQRQRYSAYSTYLKQGNGQGRQQINKKYSSSNQNLSKFAIQDIFEEELAFGNQQFCRIKMKIMDNIKKQTVAQSLPPESKSSKKLLGRFFRQSSFKKSKGKNKGLSLNSSSNKTEISDSHYESSNPLTKHLFEKYRVLVNRGK